MKQRFIISNDMVWEVLSVTERNFHLTKRGFTEEWVKDINNPKWRIESNWLVLYKEYHVTVKKKEEPFTRTFVMSPNEYKETFPD